MRPAVGPGLSGSPGAGDERAGESQGDRLQGGTRVLLVVFTGFTVLAAISLLVLGGHTDTFFAWTIRSRPNASFLGAAYVAGFVLSVLALREHSWRRVRIAVVTVTAFTIVTLMSTLEHLHRLHLMAGGASARLAAWVWLGVYLMIPVACLTVVVRQQRAQRSPRRGRCGGVRRALPGWLVGLLVGQGAALTAAGLVLVAGGCHLAHDDPDAAARLGVAGDPADVAGDRRLVVVFRFRDRGGHP